MTITLLGLTQQEETLFLNTLGDLGDIQFGATLADVNPATEVLSIFIDTTITAKHLEHLPNLKLIACRSTGYNHVDIHAAKVKGITVTNTPGYGSTTVAEYVFTLLLIITRKIPVVFNESHKDHPNRFSEQGTDLNGKILGIVGTGNIGKGVSKIAKGFGMDVIGYDLYPNQEAAKSLGFIYKPLPELLATADIVSLHAPYTEQTHHMIGRQQLSEMKPGAIIINTARGELLDTSALVEALQSGHISAAGLDVVESEHLQNPEILAAEAALATLPQVIITNHNAFNTIEAVGRINQMTVESIRNFATGKEVQGV